MRLIAGSIIAAALLYNGTALASGNQVVEGAGQLYRLCNNSDEPSKSACFGFIGGVFEVAANNSIDGVRSCAPSPTNVLKAQRLTLKWIAAHPDKELEPASRAIAEALGEAFPCKKTN